MMKLRAFGARILVRSQIASELATFNLQPATASAFPLGVAALARCDSLCLFVAIPTSFLCGLCDLCVRLFPSFLFGCGFAGFAALCQLVSIRGSWLGRFVVHLLLRAGLLGSMVDFAQKRRAIKTDRSGRW